MSYADAEASRMIANLIQVGSVMSVDAGNARAAVKVGEITIPAAAVAQLRAGVLSFWWMPQAGEQVVVICPGGDMARAIVLCSIFAGNAPSADAGIPLLELAGGVIRLNGTLELTGDVIAQGISLTTHTHTGVATGAGNTGGPQ